jgi:hypothetical protein
MRVRLATAPAAQRVEALAGVAASVSSAPASFGVECFLGDVSTSPPRSSGGWHAPQANADSKPHAQSARIPVKYATDSTPLGA